MSSETEIIYKSLRKTLDELGYHQSLSFDSLYLVEKIVGDLIQTTQSLKHYKELSQKSLEICGDLEVGIAPYKEDNAQLVQECNLLHQRIISQKDHYENIQKDLKCKISQLETKVDELELINGDNCSKIFDLEKDCLKKTEKIYKLQSIIITKHPQKTISKDLLEEDFTSKLNHVSNIDSTIHLLENANTKTKALGSEIKQLKRKLDESELLIDTLQTKINTRDHEIKRLNDLLEGGRPVCAVIKDYGCGDSQIKMSFCTCEKKSLCKYVGMDQQNRQLQLKLKECTGRQQDAMLHALKLAEKNKILEEQLKDSLEDTKYKSMLDLQDKMITSLTKTIEDLRKDNDTKSSISLKSKFDKKYNEEIDTLKRKIEDFKIIENDLNNVIDRLEKDNIFHKTYIADLESKYLKCFTEKEDLGRTAKVNNIIHEKNEAENEDFKKSSERNVKEHQSNTCHITDQGFENIIRERDHYQREYSHLVEKLISIPLKLHETCRDFPLSNLVTLISERDQYHEKYQSLHRQCDENRNDCQSELKRRLSDQSKEIYELKNKYRLLQEESCNNSCRDRSGFSARHHDQDRIKSSPNLPPGTGVDLQTYLSLQDERDKLHSCNCKLQEEKAELLTRLKKVQSDACTNTEDRIRGLESERNNLISKHGELNCFITNLEDMNQELKKRLYQLENELIEERNSTHGIKRIQEQTDEALFNFRKTHESLERQLEEMKKKNTQLEIDRDGVCSQLQNLRDENQRLRSQLVSLDNQKDSMLMTLDSKVDLLSRLQRDLELREIKVQQLEQRVATLKSKLDETLNLNKKTEQEAHKRMDDFYQLRSEILHLQDERNDTLSENRRLQNELYQANQEALEAKRLLEASKSEVDELKMQLQHYCQEVQQIEDILSKKESERLDLLTHFKSLTQETAELENNNHSLDGEMKHCKQKLINAEKDIMKLEASLQDKDCTIKSLEGKLQELSCLTAQLESQIQNLQDDKFRKQDELTECQETVQKLMMQKEVLSQELATLENCNAKNEDELKQKRFINATLNDQISKERENASNLETCLRQLKSEIHDKILRTQKYEQENKSLCDQVRLLSDKLEQEQSENEQYEKFIGGLKKDLTSRRYTKDSCGDHNQQAHTRTGFHSNKLNFILPSAKRLSSSPPPSRELTFSPQNNFLFQSPQEMSYTNKSNLAAPQRDFSPKRQRNYRSNKANKYCSPNRCSINDPNMSLNISPQFKYSSPTRFPKLKSRTASKYPLKLPSLHFEALNQSQVKNNKFI